MFLVLTAAPNLVATPRSAILERLLVAALRGSESAQGVVAAVLTHFGAIVEEEVQAHVRDWLGKAASSGSILT